ncbi:hypothetical protein TA3x_002172 [Tundrisphaera sp. TA3]|uniref:hypothetical protein n=1 Tax=Tundrisphaera sp. TA3 TaxID=3435775 RepID=UPI003EBE2ADC
MFLLAVGVVLIAIGLYSLAAGMLGDPPRPGLPPARPTTPAASIINALGGAFATLWGGGLFFSGLQCVAMGALCRLAIQVEANTRASAEHLARIRSRAEPAREDAARFFVS